VKPYLLPTFELSNYPHHSLSSTLKLSATHRNPLCTVRLVVSVLFTHSPLPRCSSKRVDPHATLWAHPACETSSPLICSILNVSSHELSVTHRKAGQTLIWHYTPGSNIGLRSFMSPERRQRSSLQRGFGLRVAQNAPNASSRARAMRAQHR
jgi:hypothetical protein